MPDREKALRDAKLIKKRKSLDAVSRDDVKNILDVLLEDEPEAFLEVMKAFYKNDPVKFVIDLEEAVEKIGFDSLEAFGKHIEQKISEH